MASFYPDLYRTALGLLIEVRERAGLTPQQLAAHFGQPEALVTSYEDGTRLLDPAEFIAVVRALGADPYALLKEAEQRTGDA